ncbi:MAG: cobalamin B12-binding domain-containing protein [Actinobacteria bacterium]|nr:cobalamin B12-binding domain-containing protein [Actinomycetota bacterium]
MKKILGATVGSCIHVAGIINFLNIAKTAGFKTKFLGTVIDIKTLNDALKTFDPDFVALSYRLSPESAVPVFKEIKENFRGLILNSNNQKIIFILGTTKPVEETLRKSGNADIFDRIFTGAEGIEEIKEYLCNKKIIKAAQKIPPQNLFERIKYKTPLPLLRHHFGRPDFGETVKGIKTIAESKLIDVISLGPDQNTQEFFFHPEKMDKKQDGAGGVPIRSAQDLKKLYEASRTGNYPLMRCYSGTNDIIKFAELLADNIKNAWCAVPLCWYNELDNRSKRTLEESISENQSVMKWHAARNIPVEVNESHHWSLRYAPDSIAVAAAYIAAYNAKKMGVKTYISQYMFNTPSETSFKMDLAKMLAKIELIESLHDENFMTLRQSRTGLYSMSGNFNANKGQLAASTMLQMQINPAIVHVVAYCESEHAAKPEDIIESSEIVIKVIDNYLNGCPDMKTDGEVILRKRRLTNDAKLIIEKIKELDVNKKYEDPLTAPEIIVRSIKTGILDAPHLKNVKAASGKIKTGFFNGANLTVDEYGNPISEEKRLKNIIT